MTDRQQQLGSLRTNPDIDVLIVGGGINGIGTFRDLAANGVDVLLVEQNDFCSGTSATSSHMLHGGIRYLENGEFRLVNEALHERNRLLRNAPHYAKPLRTTIPMFKTFSGFLNAPLKFMGLLDKPSERGSAVIRIGLIIYDWFTRNDRAMPTHTFKGKRESLKAFPELNPNINSTATYYDGYMTSPERIAVELALDGEKGQAESRAFAVNYLKLEAASGNTVRLLDEASDESLDVRPKIVINAAGPWIDIANGKMKKDTQFIGGTKGSHIVVDNPKLFEATAGSEFFFENEDGRITLIFPWLDRVIMGTTDIRVDEPATVMDDSELEYIMSIRDHIFPNINVTEDDIVFTFSGVRPLPRADANTTGQISRDHSMRVMEADDTLDFPVLSLVGGKWTTYRAFGEQVTDAVLERLGKTRQTNTRDLPIGGGAEYPSTDKSRQDFLTNNAERLGISKHRLEQLLDRYGTLSLTIAEFISEGEDRQVSALKGYSIREIMYLAENEKVINLDDILLRRSTLAWRGLVTLEALEDIAKAVQPVLGWSDQETKAQVERTLDLLKRTHRVELRPEANPALVPTSAAT